MGWCVIQIQSWNTEPLAYRVRKRLVQDTKNWDECAVEILGTYSFNGIGRIGY
jgi:hypothetical protein